MLLDVTLSTKKCEISVDFWPMLCYNCIMHLYNYVTKKYTFSQLAALMVLRFKSSLLKG